MQIVRIFGEEVDGKPNGLYAFYTETEDGEPQDEFYAFLERIYDPQYLLQFFRQRKSELQKPLYRGISIEEAIHETIDEAERFEDELSQQMDEGVEVLSAYLENRFKPLDNNDYRQTEMQPSKTKGHRRHSWLRFYAIRVAPGFYIITGGGLKLVHLMDEDDLLKEELNKLQKARNFLKDEGLYDTEAYTELILDL